MSPPQDNLPGKGLMGWLGRQIGYVTKALHTEVHPPLTPPASSQPSPQPSSAASPLYRQTQVEEKPHPANPQVTLRRTIIDEALPK